MKSEQQQKAEKERESLDPWQRKVLDRFMSHYPDIPLPEALEMFKEAGG